MLVVIAEKEELKLVEELGYSNNPVVITGVGGMNVVNALKSLPKDTEIVNIGYCGSNEYKVGTVVRVVGVSTNHGVAKFYEPSKLLNEDYTKKYDKMAFCYTSTDFVEKTTKGIPCVFDMELAFICALFDNVQAIKVVSDKLSIKQYRENS